MSNALAQLPRPFMITRSNIADYVVWDDNQKRYDMTPKMFAEQMQPDVRQVMEFVLRSWFIPQHTTIIRRWFEPLPKAAKAAKTAKAEQLSFQF